MQLQRTDEKYCYEISTIKELCLAAGSVNWDQQHYTDWFLHTFVNRAPDLPQHGAEWFTNNSSSSAPSTGSGVGIEFEQMSPEFVEASQR